jgi:hypothetical protein
MAASAVYDRQAALRRKQQQGAGMTFQPYPTGNGGSEVASVAGRPPQPPALRNAVRLMWAGAAIALISVVLTLILSSKVRSAVTKAAVKANVTKRSDGKTVLTTSQIHSLASLTVVFLVVVGVIAVVLWAWMAWANNKGRSWARIVATVLFGLNTISLLLDVSRAGITIIPVVLGWLIGLVAVVLLWRKETTAHIKPQVQ